MVYGDALGFLNENNNENTMNFKTFRFRRDNQLELDLAIGQWSDLTELSLIMIKCLLDEKEKTKVTIDYSRLQAELDLWNYYRHGGADTILLRLKEGESYYQNSQYANDKRGYGFSRIMSIILTNKNFEIAKEEIIRQIMYFNEHPQVILTGMLLGRIVFTLLEKGSRSRIELLDELKTFIISLEKNQLEVLIQKEFTKKYTIQFEQEKINYLMALDRLKSNKDTLIKLNKIDSQGVLLAALENYWLLQEGALPDFNLTPSNDIKEALTLAYGFWGINKTSKEDVNIMGIKDHKFIESMGEYIGRIRNYELNRRPYQPNNKEIDLFQLQLGTVIRHPILNNTKIIHRQEKQQWIKLILETKGGTYILYKNK